MSRRRKTRTPGNQYNSFENSKYYTQVVNNDYLMRMCEIYLSLYKIHALPKSIDLRYLNLTMMYQPGIVFFEDEVLKEDYPDYNLLALPFQASGYPDIYRNPTSVQVYGSNGYTNSLKKGEFIIVWSNWMRYAPIATIQIFAQRMTEIQRTIDVNLQNQKIPKIVKTSNNQRLTTENILKETDGFVPKIVVDEGYNQDNFTAIDISSPYLLDKLDLHNNFVWNQYLTWCGIENANTDKKERLVANEVMGNYGNVEMSRNTGLESRQYGFDMVNERFGTHITVEFNSQIPTLLNNILPVDKPYIF